MIIGGAIVTLRVPSMAQIDLVEDYLYWIELD